MTNWFAISDSTATESTDKIAGHIDFTFSKMNPLIDKSSFLRCSTEKTSVWSKAGHYSLMRISISSGQKNEKHDKK